MKLGWGLKKACSGVDTLEYQNAKIFFPFFFQRESIPPKHNWFRTSTSPETKNLEYNSLSTNAHPSTTRSVPNVLFKATFTLIKNTSTSNLPVCDGLKTTDYP